MRARAKKGEVPYHTHIIKMRRRKGGGGSNSLVWRQRGRTREKYHVLYRWLKARLSYFPVKLVIIASEFAILNEDTRLSCDGPVIIAQPDRTFGPRLNLV